MELKAVSDEIIRVSRRVEAAADSLFQLGKKKAETERDYRVALSKELLRLKTEKVPATLIPDLARGAVAEYMFQRDIAEANFKSGVEAASALKSTLSALQSILKFQQDV